MKAFKAYDIRGVYNRDFNKEDVYKIGFLIPKLLTTDKVIIGRDARVSSNEIFNALSSGIMDAGADVHNIGLSTTPMVYWATKKLSFDASVQITASHNPPEYNGMKISKTDALPVGSESGLKELEIMFNTYKIQPVPDEAKGKVVHIDIKPRYIDFMKHYLPDLSSLNITIDCSNGMAALLIRDILGNKPTYIYETLDGTFPNHEPNPLEIENVRDLSAAVRTNGSDLGIIFDGDADRVMFVDENGTFISPDIITAVLGEYLLKDQKGWVVQDIRTSRATSAYLENLGAKVFSWKVGHSFAKLKLRELNAVFGGELSGHYYFRDFNYCDSGILASLIVLQVASGLKELGRNISRYIAEIQTFSGSGEVNFRIERKQDAMEELKNHFSSKYQVIDIKDFDGYRLDFNDWWFNVRPSNTEPYLRLVVEAENDKLLKERLSELTTVLQKFT